MKNNNINNKFIAFLKIDCIVKIMTCIFLCTFFSVLAYTQEKRLSINKNNCSLKDIFNTIENKTEFTFFFNDNQIEVNKKVSVIANNETIDTILKQVLSQTDYTYQIIERQILINPKEKEIVFNTRSKETNQDKQKVEGQVIDSNGLPIVGANVIVKGTTNGTITDIDGNFTLDVPTNAILNITYIGYENCEVKIGKKTTLIITMQEDFQALEEVVVTALGIRREEKALGYAVQKVSGEKISQIKGVNIMSSLTGKIAGLNIQNSTEFNENAKILLRGEKPIVIVDGVPYESIGLNEIASDDIESIDVLKGATASALYGSRGSAGAIMITTKKGSKKEGLHVNINSNTMFFSGYLAFPKTHSAYSSGTSGKYSNDYVWGDKLDIGRTAVLYNPQTYEWEEQVLTSKGKNNFKNFLQFSFVTNNNISISHKGKYGSFRTSLTEIYNKGQYPNQDLNKISFTVAGEMEWKKIKFEASAAYNKHISSNNNGSGYSSSYIYDLVIWGSSVYDIREFKDYWIHGKEEQQQNWYDRSWYDNPWFKANEVIDAYDTDIMNTAVTGSYEIASWLKAMVRTGLDVASQRNEKRNAMSANYSWDKKGFFGLSRTTDFSVNADVILMAERTWGKFIAEGLIGGNIYYYRYDQMRSTTAGGLSVPGYYSLNASLDPIKANSYLKQKRVNSLYGKLSFSWNSTYFLDITGRNDWSSTLRSDERSYFYPSLSGSIVLSEIINLPKWWDFLKLRGSWTVTKKDASIYANNNVYSVQKNVWSGMTSASYPSTLIGGIVKPKKTAVWETGFASNFFKNRLYIDFAYYRKYESDFIISGGVSSMTGYNSIQTNFKETRLRSGFEVTIGATPIKIEDFSWDILTNFAHDQYTYQTIDPKYSVKKSWIKKGATWDWFAIKDWERAPNGNLIHNGAGMPIRQNFISKLGKKTPDLIWGISNTLKYKNIGFSFAFDGRIGGLSFSRTHQMLMNSGSGIDTDTKWRYEEVVNGEKTYIGSGVKIISGNVQYDPDGNVISDTRKFAPNDIVVSYETYTNKYHDSASRPSTQNVLDETFIKLRNLSINYELPNTWCEKMKIKSASIGVTGENLLLWAKDYKYADPDKGGDNRGYENLNSPSQRYIGFNIKANF